MGVMGVRRGVGKTARGVRKPAGVAVAEGRRAGNDEAMAEGVEVSRGAGTEQPLITTIKTSNPAIRRRGREMGSIS